MMKLCGGQLSTIVNLEIVRLCRGWLGYDAIHDDLLRHHHKREFYGGLKDELLPIAWHPDRWWDWCVDEDEKRWIDGAIDALMKIREA